MIEKLANTISANAIFFLVLIVILILAVFALYICMRYLMKLVPKKPGSIGTTVKEEFIVLDPLTSLVNTKTNEKCQVADILDKIWSNHARKLSSFYKKPFQISMRIESTVCIKDTSLFYIIVSDKAGNLYQIIPDDTTPRTLTLSLKQKDKNSKGKNRNDKNDVTD